MFTGKFGKKNIRHFVMLPLIAQTTSNHDVFSSVTATLHQWNVVISMVFIPNFTFAVKTFAILLCVLALNISYGMSTPHSQFSGATMRGIYSSFFSTSSGSPILAGMLENAFSIDKTIAPYLITMREQILPFLFKYFFLMGCIVQPHSSINFIAVNAVVLFALFEFAFSIISIVLAEIFAAITFLCLIILAFTFTTVCMQPFTTMRIRTKTNFGRGFELATFRALSQRLRFIQHSRLATPSAIYSMSIIPQIPLKFTEVNL